MNNGIKKDLSALRTREAFPVMVLCPTTAMSGRPHVCKEPWIRAAYTYMC